MKRGYVGLALGALVVLGAALSLPSCGHDQKLVSMQITPATATFPEPGFTPPPANPTQQYVATATYIHPPATKDVTSQATWTIDNDVATMSSPGLFNATPPPAGSPPGTAGPCGVADILVSIPEGTGGSSNIVTAVATVTVNNPANILCPGGGTETTLSVQVTGNGNVTSTTGNINCGTAGTTCIAPFPVGASVGLTAMPGPGTTVTWASGCTSSSGNDCSVTIPSGGVNVLVEF